MIRRQVACGMEIEAGGHFVQQIFVAEKLDLPQTLGEQSIRGKLAPENAFKVSIPKF